MKSIAVIPKSTTQVFWKTVEAGAREGAKEAGVEMVWKGSLNEDDPAQQIQIVVQKGPAQEANPPPSRSPAPLFPAWANNRWASMAPARRPFLTGIQTFGQNLKTKRDQVGRLSTWFSMLYIVEDTRAGYDPGPESNFRNP